MNGREALGERLLALFLLALLLFNAPFLIIFDKPAMVFGVPLLVAYMFMAWLALIAGLAYVTLRYDEPEPDGAGAPGSLSAGDGERVEATGGETARTRQDGNLGTESR